MQQQMPRTEVLISASQIEVEIDRVAREVNEHYRSRGISRIVMVVILNGGVWFFIDLCRSLERLNHGREGIVVIPDFMSASSYEESDGSGRMESSGEVKIYKDIQVPVAGEHVLIVDDIADTLRTLEKVKAIIDVHKPASIEIAAMLRKQGRAKVEVDVRFVAKEIPDLYVVGRGLDSKGLLRTLEDICIVVD